MAGMLAACTGPDLSYLAAVVARLQNARGGYRVGLVLCSPYSYCLSNTDSDDVRTPFADLEQVRVWLFTAGTPANTDFARFNFQVPTRTYGCIPATDPREALFKQDRTEG